MKLLFDQNMSFKLCGHLADLLPNSSHVRLLGLEKAVDFAVWQYAGANGYALVSLDADFAEMAALLGPPPKVIWLRRGNQSTADVGDLLRNHAEAINAFESDAAACLEIYQPRRVPKRVHCASARSLLYESRLISSAVPRTPSLP